METEGRQHTRADLASLLPPPPPPLLLPPPPPTACTLSAAHRPAGAMAAAGPGGSADKASKVKSLLASYYDLDDAEGEPSPSLYDTPRCVGAGGCKLHSRSKTVLHVVP